MKYTLSIQPSNCIPGHLSQRNSYVHPKICQQPFIAALFIIAKTGNNQNVLKQVNGWTDCGNPNMDYYSKNETIDTCNNLDGSQGHDSVWEEKMQKVTYHMLPFI